MKHLIYFQLVTLLLISGSVSLAQSDKKYNKTMDKVYKEKLKELKKQGFQVSGTSLTLEAALMKHLKPIISEPDKNKEKIGEVTMCKSANVCKSNALNNVLLEYSNESGSFVRGRVVSDMFNNASASVPEEFDKFYGAYERLVQAEIRGELEFSFAVEKPNGDGKTYQAYYILNEEKASKARLRAMQRAAEETKLAQQYANQVSNFVQEAFDN